MIAAIYARKSTRDDGTDATRSVARQIAACREFARSRGWQTDDALIFADDEVPAIDWDRRLGWRRVLDSLGKFERLVVTDQDRIGRDARGLVELQQIEEAGVEVWVSTGERLSIIEESGEVNAYVRALVGSLERRRARRRTRDGLRNLAEQGFVAGGRVLGYRAEGPTKARRLVVDEGQAKLVRRIFEMAASGHGLLRIARTLNTEGILNPTGQDRRTTTKKSQHWSPTGIRAVLRRRLYLGEVIYGAKRNEYRNGRRIKVAGTPITRREDSLRIIPDDLWRAAHARIDATRRAYLTTTNGKLNGKPLSGIAGKYRLSGLVRCGHCGSPLMISRSTGQRGKPSVTLVCAGRRSRPGGGCTMERGIPEPVLADLTVTVLRDYFVESEEFQQIISEHSRRWSAPRDDSQRQALLARISALDTELGRLTAAIVAGRAPASIVKAIEEREQEKADLEASAARLAPKKPVDPARVQEAIEQLMITA